MMLKKTVPVIVIASVVLLAGCTAMQKRKSGVSATETNRDAVLAEKDGEIKELRSSLDEVTLDLERQQAAAERAAAAAEEAEQAAREAEARLSEESRAEPVATPVQVGSGLLPPNAKAGQCYARVFVPPAYGQESVKVLKQDASERVEIEPGKYDWVDERVLISESSERIEVIPATYKTVEERVLVKEASTRMEEVPAVYDWVEERILVEPAHKVWKEGRGPVEKVDNATGEIMCLVDVPAKYETVRKRVLKTPATVRETEIPAEYKMISKQVVGKPATTAMVAIPAKYDTIRVKKIVSPPQERRVGIPAEYENVTKTVQRSEGRMEWRAVLCETNMSSAKLREIQLALKGAGYDPVLIDGVYGPLTQKALASFQKTNGLATGGLTLATLSRLGVEPGS